MDLRVSFVVLLAVTAGCSAFTATDEPTPTVTPVPVPEVTNATSTPTGIAPGLSGGGVSNVDQLASAHERIASNRSYVWRDRKATKSRSETTEASTSVRQELRVENHRRYSYWTDTRRVESGSGTRFLGNFTAFADGEARYERYQQFGERNLTYNRSPVVNLSDHSDADATSAIRRYLDVPSATVAESVMDGRLYYRVVGHRDSVPWVANASHYRVTALVSSEGFVRSLNATYVVVEPDRHRRVTYEYQYGHVGQTTVERPEWVSSRWSTATASNRLHPHSLDEN